MYPAASCNILFLFRTKREVPVRPETKTKTTIADMGFTPHRNDKAKKVAVTAPIAAICILIFHLNETSNSAIINSTQAIMKSLKTGKN